ncbi:MAG: hypothetical protein OEZ22_11760 [Spirochaetia bacterium]|nr:hypothetical protein [Spirochaetia bacterium]
MSDRKIAILLMLTILFFSGVFVFVLDMMGIIQAADYLTFLRPKNPPVSSDMELPSEVEKVSFQKWEEKLIEKEEKLVSMEEKIKEKTDSLDQKEKEIKEFMNSMQKEKEKLYMITKDWEDRKKKIEDMAGKVTSMPPEKAREMMENWRDFDIIEVLRQIDRTAEEEGMASISPYLLTLFNPKRRAEITRKMLLPPLEQEMPLKSAVNESEEKEEENQVEEPIQ